jgi:hypothetical protein
MNKISKIGITLGLVAATALATEYLLSPHTPKRNFGEPGKRSVSIPGTTNLDQDYRKISKMNKISKIGITLGLVAATALATGYLLSPHTPKRNFGVENKWSVSIPGTTNLDHLLENENVHFQYNILVPPCEVPKFSPIYHELEQNKIFDNNYFNPLYAYVNRDGIVIVMETYLGISSGHSEHLVNHDGVESVEKTAGYSNATINASSPKEVSDLVNTIKSYSDRIQAVCTYKEN